MILSSYIKFQKQFKITNKLEQIAIKDKRGKIVSFDVGFNLRHPFTQYKCPIYRVEHFFMSKAIFSTLD